MADKHVTINPGPAVVPSTPVHVSKGNNEQVVWTNNAGETATISFTTSPFASSSYTINNNASRGSGPPTVQPGSTQYKYSVTVGGKSLDPDVVVDN